MRLQDEGDLPEVRKILDDLYKRTIAQDLKEGGDWFSTRLLFEIQFTGTPLSGALFRSLLNHSEPKLRRAICSGLAALQEEADLDLLEARLRNEDADVRRVALTAVAYIGNGSVTWTR